jgi:3-deoxy-7-phosphoheptulonate synthase
LKTLQAKYEYEKVNNLWLNSLTHNGGKPLIIAGPCAVEDYQTVLKTAIYLLKSGVKYMRAGAYKPRTSPYSFQGLGKMGLDILKAVKKETGIKIVTELVSEMYYPEVDEVTDIIQIGSRNAQNFELLKCAGKGVKPVLLKRGMMNTVEEFLFAAEYVLSEGNSKVILCERGIRSFDNTLRNTLDVGAIAVLKSKTNLPVIVDPSHASGKRKFVIPLACAGMAAGADGIIVEVHPEPEFAKCDGKQSVDLKTFIELKHRINEMYTYSRY